MRTPQLLILDPQIVHEIFVTDFNHFEDNDVGKLVNCFSKYLNKKIKNIS